MSGPLQPLSAVLSGRVADLEARALQAFKLTDVVRSALPEPEKNHVLSASYREEMLVISTDSAMWTARIRYLEEALRARLAEIGEKPFTKLKVRVGMPSD